jgi:ubiquinone/menaquinone biosynthesis C-methylase UbiE
MISDHYRINTPFIVRDFNKLFPVPYYISEMLIKRGNYKIADVGAGPVCKLGGKMAGANLEIYASDVLAKEYKKLTDEIGQELLIPIEYQDIENMTYPDNFFDIVHCVNTLDHTKNARKAIEEMKRICKVGGWVYLRHAPYQKRYLRGDHYWDATMEGFDNGREKITMEEFKTGTDGFMIIHTWKKNEIN